MEKLTFKLDDFEGPLDLLLHLINRHRMDILNIPILELLEQYLDAIRTWQQMDLEVASEFLEMAARLIHMKTVMLLPRHEEESAELQRALSGELLEYHLIQQVAAEFETMTGGFALFTRRPDELPAAEELYGLEHSSRLLYDAMRSAFGRQARRLPPPVTAFSGIVKRPQISVASRVVHVLRRFHARPSMPFEELFGACESRPELVATFLAVLELMRAGRVRFDESNQQLEFIDRKEKGRRQVAHGIS